MKPTTVKTLLLLCLITSCALLVYCSKSETDQPLTKEDQIKRGAYLVNVGVCNDCHTPKRMTEKGPVPDESILLSGHPANATIAVLPPGVPDPAGWIAATNGHMTAWAGPWGVSFAANLTPDKATGTGNWKEQDFINTIRNGKHLGNGRDILPPMPWPFYRNLTDDDLKAIFAYLQSLPPVPNLVPGPLPPTNGQAASTKP